MDTSGVGERWVYPAELANAVRGLGLAPRTDTPPALVRDALNDLYRFELRRIRARLIRGDVERHDYLELVVSLRKKYWMLTLPLAGWERICGASTSDL
jgi:hypothetical protein